MEAIDPSTHAKYIKAIADITQAITTEQPVDTLLNRIVMTTARLMDYEICSIWLVDNDAAPRVIRLEATQAVDPDYARPRTMGRVEGVAGFVATHNQILRIHDVLKEPRFKEKTLAEKLGLVPMLSVPIRIRDDEAMGVLDVFTNQPHEFSESEVHMVSAVANLAALAIRSGDLREETRSVQEELETRKLVERAKEVLVRRRGLDAHEAFRWIQKRSMDSRKTMRQIAEAVLISEDV
ncbi:MAG: GAF and ANTAR domain-containing protein [Deltaproteobacteria bacterium]|nr:GAF and ANTAR domain-containing protein [Deltaproteobacteria bacterium]